MKLRDYFKKHNRIAIAFSGGVDSAYLLHEAIAAGAEVTAYYVRTPFQPEFEYRDALSIADNLGAKLRVLEADPLECEDIASNPSNRCYHCKKLLFNRILAAAAADGYSLVADGTNATDDWDDRPGMKALMELSVVSPLRECGLSKSEIRTNSKEAGLWTWNKPAYACLATRVPVGVRITAEQLDRIERSENMLSELGFRNFRVRLMGNYARLELTEEDQHRALKLRREIIERLGPLYDGIVIDIITR